MMLRKCELGSNKVENFTVPYPAIVDIQSATSLQHLTQVKLFQQVNQLQVI